MVLRLRSKEARRVAWLICPICELQHTVAGCVCTRRLVVDKSYVVEEKVRVLTEDAEPRTHVMATHHEQYDGAHPAYLVSPS
jgi:hypothetical protein